MLVASGQLFSIPKMYISIHKRHPYTANLSSEMSGDSKSTSLHCGDILGLPKVDCRGSLLGMPTWRDRHMQPGASSQLPQLLCI